MFEQLADKLTSNDRILHIFSGPFLGVVKYTVPEETAITDSQSGATSGLSTPKAGTPVSGATSLPNSASAANTPKLKHTDSCSSSSITTEDCASSIQTYLEFYSWDSVFSTDGQNVSSLSSVLQKVRHIFLGLSSHLIIYFLIKFRLDQRFHVHCSLNGKI